MEEQGAELGGHHGHPASRDGLVTQTAHGPLLDALHHVGHVQGHVVTSRHKCIVTHLEQELRYITTFHPRDHLRTVLQSVPDTTGRDLLT